MAPPTTSRLRAGLAGVAAALLGAAVTSVVAWTRRGARSPFEALGDLVITRSPRALQEWAITTLGANDRLVIVAAMVLVVAILGWVTGVVARRGIGRGWAAVGVVAAMGAAAVIRDPIAATVPSLLAVVVGAGVSGGALGLLLGRATGETDEDRRRFLVAGWGTAGLALAVTVVGRSVTNRLVAALDRAEVTLPAPADPADPVPPELPDAVTPLVVPNDKFYRVDTVLNVPVVPLDSWRLTVTGRVDRPFTLTYDELLAFPMIERHVTIACVSNPIGGGYVGNALWQGVPLADILGRARPQPEATQIVGRSVDGWTAGFPTRHAFDGRDAMVAVAMNGEPLPARHGFPARLIVPGLYGYVSATKWLSEIELTRWEDFDAFWVTRAWAKEAPVKTQSRIDRPNPFDAIPPGPVVLAGVAWATHRGISAVEVQIDDGDWVPATLSESMGDDVWRQWSVTVDLEPGYKVARVRAADGTGTFQSGTFVDVLPDGAEGYDVLRFKVEEPA